MTERNLIECKNVELSFTKGKKGVYKALDRINFTLKQGEIVAIVGKSGAGKSSFLRVISGLIQPDYGQVLYKDKPVTSVIEDMAMVFQSFALLPWLSVLENVLFGIDAMGVSRKQSEKSALNMIEVIGLKGFEKHRVSELSGGMKQRVGFARALMVSPEILLLDEPFSSLDIATAKKLREDILSLWVNKKIATQSIVMVTHNIEEAVLMADRVIVFDAHPGRVAYEHTIDAPRPRVLEADQVQLAIKTITHMLYQLDEASLLS
ncbi:ABC transporter ATP-binding protein [Fangia hongkongensis]|uniref:ABC transporter ATP-binding protein n=1 Tax=Fangia hongkongensis TaxID=270495 RepID=UPI000382F1D5|nr:ABC transporter ATP-binding protein [Fangia hongkongensis]MBK2125329.1 ABC transporter ATP-binding protein [Fangia hongkongensis]